MECLPNQEPRKLKIVEKGIKPCRQLNSVLNKNLAPPIKKHELNLGPTHKEKETVAFILENVLTSEECQKLIEIAEQTNFNPARLISGNDGSAPEIAPGYRDCSRLVIDDEEFSKIIFERIAQFLPPTFKQESLLGVYERLRFLRYDQGDKFAAHVDGPGNCGNLNCALITLEIYLNDGFCGGETTFLYQKENERLERVPVVPKVGTILVFQHELIHEGSILENGFKYTIWADVVYTKTKIEEESPLILDLEYFSLDEFHRQD